MSSNFDRYLSQWVVVNTLGGFTYIGTLISANAALLLQGSDESVTTVAKDYVVGIALSNAPRAHPNSNFTRNDYDPDAPWVS